MHCRHLVPVAAISLALVAGCGGAPATESSSASTTGVSAATSEVRTAVRVFCKDDGLFPDSTGLRPFGVPPRDAQLRVEVPTLPQATRARVSFTTVAGDVHGYANTNALGLFVRETTLMNGAPVHLGVGGTVCVPLHGETPESLPCEVTVELPAGWTFELVPPVRVEGTSHTWRGRVARGAVALTRGGGERRYSGMFNGTTLELLTEDGRVLARGPAPRTGTMIRGRRGDLLEVALTEFLGLNGLRGFIRSPPEPEPPPTEPGSRAGSSSFGMGGLGLASGPSLPREARPLARVATDRPLHALVPGQVLTLPTGQRLSLPDPAYARVAVGTRWVFVVFADGTFLAGTVDPTAIGELILAAEGQ